MTKYHVNPETGRPNRCKADKQPCAYAVDGQEPPHYATKEDAKAGYSKTAEQEYGAFATVKNSNNTKDSESSKKDMRKHPDFGNIDAQTSLDTSFRIDENGTVVSGEGVYPPDVECYSDGKIDIQDRHREWEPVTGFSGQYGYSGPMMHASEAMDGSSMELYVRENPGVYAVVNPLNGDYDPYGEDDDINNDSYTDSWVLLKENPEARETQTPLSDLISAGYLIGKEPFNKEGQTAGEVIHVGQRVGNYVTDNKTGVTTTIFKSKSAKEYAELILASNINGRKAKTLKSDMADLYMCGYKMTRENVSKDSQEGELVKDGITIGTYTTDLNTGDTVSTFYDEEEKVFAERTVKAAQNS